jgi:hypothetical protein
MVMFGLMKAVTPQIARSIAFFDSSQKLWKELRDRYSKGDHYRVSDLLHAVHSIKLGERSVSNYFLHLQSLWQELDALRPIFQCTCPTLCTCDLARNVTRAHENEYVICFLKGLNDPYDFVRIQIMHSDPLPRIASIFAHIQPQERQDSINPFLDVKPQPSVAAVNWKF